jgi:hypothetical protein
MSEHYEQALREKWRYESSKGLISVEDLWFLPLTSKSANVVSLDTVALTLNRSIEATAGTTDSFVFPTQRKSSVPNKMLELIVHIIGVRKKEAEAVESVAKKKVEKTRILELISEKKDESLKSKSIEELTKLVEEL